MVAVAADPTTVQTVIVPIIVALLAGSTASAVAGAIRDHRLHRAAPSKPALEEEALRVGNESITVVTMERALNAANTRITELEDRLADCERRESKLERLLRRREDEIADLKSRLN